MVNIVKMVRKVLYWICCGIYLYGLSLSQPVSENDTYMECYQNASKVFCYWVIDARQNASTSEDQCQENGGTLAYFPNEDVFSDISDLVRDQLFGFWNFLYIGYKKSSSSEIVVQGTNEVQSWMQWAMGYPTHNSGDCITLFTLTREIRNSLCSALTYAICSASYEIELAADVSTSATTDMSTTITTYNAIYSTFQSIGEMSTSRITDAIPGLPSSTNALLCCPCNEKQTIFINLNINITEELQEQLDTLKKETKVDEENLSSTIRKKTCASDPRPSSAYVGYLGIGLMAVVFGGLFLLDLLTVFTALYVVVKNH